MAEREESVVMSFGKYKGQKIRDVPLTYLRWWKASLIDGLRLCSAEILRREEMGLTEEEELQLSTLPSWVRENLLDRLEVCSDEDQRAQIHGMIRFKFEEYSPKRHGSAYAASLQGREGDEDGICGDEEQFG